MRLYLVPFLLASIYLIHSSTASAEMVCADKGGRLAIRSACKKGETQISFSALGVVGAQGPKGDAGRGLRKLVDANGNKIGDVIELIQNSDVRIISEINGQEYLLIGNKLDIIGYPISGQTDRLLFESVDCSGQAYVPEAALLDHSHLVRPGIVIGTTRTLYALDSEATTQSVALGSFLPVNGACHPISPQETMAVAPVDPIANLLQMFTRPFKLEAQ